MRLDIDHVQALAQELLHLSLTPVDNTPGAHPGVEGCGKDFHAVVDAALATYTDNVAALLHTAHEMGRSALNTLWVVADTDATFAAELSGLPDHE